MFYQYGWNESLNVWKGVCIMSEQLCLLQLKNPFGKKVIHVDFNVDVTKISLRVGHLLKW